MTNTKIKKDSMNSLYHGIFVYRVPHKCVIKLSIFFSNGTCCIFFTFLDCYFCTSENKYLLIFVFSTGGYVLSIQQLLCICIATNYALDLLIDITKNVYLGLYIDTTFYIIQSVHTANTCPLILYHIGFTYFPMSFYISREIIIKSMV